MEFVDRKKEFSRLQKALLREKPQFIAVYGRRRIGKSTLIKKVMDFSRGDIYFLADKTSEPSQRQLFSAVGQVKLVGLYYDLFREFGIHVGQVLTMKENFEPGEQYRNQRACMTVMLENDVLPIVNENDTVSVTELMFTDNDELSGLIAQMMQADTLILLSNIDGIFTTPPDDPSADLIREVAPGRDLSEYIQPEKSAFGRGGMHSKYTTAAKVSQAGIRVIIANGERENILVDLIEHNNETPHTEFTPVQTTPNPS